jgi:dethiobiotin synthetase
MLRRLTKPSLFVTATDTDVGKTVVAGAIGNWFWRHGCRVGVSKPLASGCVRRFGELISEDAEFLAQVCNSPHELDVICPQRFVEPLAPAVAAERMNVQVDWEIVQQSLDTIEADSEVVIVEGAGGILVPTDDRHTMLDLVRWLGSPALVVARPGLGTINHTLLTIGALQIAKVPILGVVINGYPAESPDVASETNPQWIERMSGVPVLSIVPHTPMKGASIPGDIAAAIATCDWASLLGVRLEKLDNNTRPPRLE